MSNITDKELLAICNLSNLKMEFANLIKDTSEIDISQGDTGKQNNTNHTIYSLLEKEAKALKDNVVADRVFLRKKEDKKNKKIVETPIYKNIIDLKKEAGIVYEYCEKFSYDKDNKIHPGSFTDDWEILYAGDTYKIIAEYYDLYQKYLTKALVSESEKLKTYLIKKGSVQKGNENQKNNAKEIGEKVIKESNESEKEKVEQLRKENIIKIVYNKKEKTFEEDKEITNEEFESFIENYKNMENMKIYPTRDEIEVAKEKQETLDKVLVIIDIASVVIPAIGGPLSKGMRAASIAKNHPAYIYIYNLLKRNVLSSIGNPLNNLITNLTESYLTANISNLIKNFLESKNARSFLCDVVEGVFKDYKNNIMSLTKANIIGSLFFTLPFFTYTELSNLINKIKDDLESRVLKDEERNEAQKKLKELEAYFNEMIVDFADSLKISEQGFGIVVLKHKLKKELVVCFKNPDVSSDTCNNIKNKSIKNESMMMRIIDEYLLYKICEDANIQRKEYKTILTGFEYGADLADMYYYVNQNLELPYEIKTFKAPYNNLALYFSKHSLANLASHFGVTVQNPVICFFKGLNFITPGNTTFLLLSFFFRISGGAFYLTGCFFYKLLIFVEALKQHDINITMETLYKKTCEYGFVNCQYYSECKNQNFKECKVIELDDGKYYPTIKEEFPNLDGEIDLSLNLLNNPNLEDFNIEPEKELEQKDCMYNVENTYIDERTTEIFSKIKIDQQDFLILLIDLKISGFSKNFKFNRINEQGEKEFVQTKFQKNSTVKMISSIFELPLENNEDTKLVKLYKNYREKKFDLLKKFEINQYFYKIFITEEGKGRIEKYLRREIKYVSYNYSQPESNNIQYSHYTPIAGSASTYVPTPRDEYIIKDEDKRVEKNIEQLKEYLTFTRELRKSIEKLINNNYIYDAGVVTYFNKLYENKDISIVPENFAYNFWVYIQDDGNMRIFNNKVEGNKFKGYVLNSDINKQYIGSFFRSTMTKIFTEVPKQEPDKNAGKQVLKNYHYPQEPKFYTEEGESSFSEMLHTHSRENYANDKSSWDEDELICRIFVTKFNAKTKSQLNKEFVELLKANREKLRQNTKKEQEDISDSKARYALSLYTAPNFNYLDKMINLIENDPSILEEFYEIEEIQQNGLKIYELVIGHFSKTEGNNENDEKYEYNKKIIEYIYNDDEIKRGLVRLKVCMPNYSEESFEIEPDKYILVEGAKLSCTEASIGEMLAGKNIIKINGKNVATLTDNKTGEQIKIFGYCDKKREMCGGECINWENESEVVYLGQKVLTTESKGTCSVYGGKISIVKNGTKKSIKVN